MFSGRNSVCNIKAYHINSNGVPYNSYKIFPSRVGYDELLVSMLEYSLYGADREWSAAQF